MSLKKKKDEASRKLDERIRVQKDYEHKYNDLSTQFSALQVKLDNMKDQNAGLQLAVRKKVEKEKYYEQKEKSLSAREKDLQTQLSKLHNLANNNTIEKDKKSSYRSTHKSRNSYSETNWTNIIPWHFVSIFLLFCLILSIIAMQLNKQ